MIFYRRLFIHSVFVNNIRVEPSECCLVYVRSIVVDIPSLSFCFHYLLFYLFMLSILVI